DGPYLLFRSLLRVSLRPLTGRSVCRPPLHFFFLILPRPPRPTLFPYTTLFRSGLLPDPLAVQPLPDLGAQVRREGEDQRGGGGRDRKSTRLNSSHGSISYAVFCLKKKKKEKHEQHREQSEDRS